jgi:hypothetical protein
MYNVQRCAVGKSSLAEGRELGLSWWSGSSGKSAYKRSEPSAV